MPNWHLASAPALVPDDVIATKVSVAQRSFVVGSHTSAVGRPATFLRRRTSSRSHRSECGQKRSQSTCTTDSLRPIKTRQRAASLTCLCFTSCHAAFTARRGTFRSSRDFPTLHLRGSLKRVCQLQEWSAKDWGCTTKRAERYPRRTLSPYL